MTQQLINIGTTKNDHTGDTLRDAGEKINANFTDLYAGAGATPIDLTSLTAAVADLETAVDSLESTTADNSAAIDALEVTTASVVADLALIHYTTLTQPEYDLLSPPDPDTLYFIVDGS